MKGWCTADIPNQTRSNEWPSLETLDLVFRIAAVHQPFYIYFDLHFNNAYYENHRIVEWARIPISLPHLL